ncbi:hypothetical protein HHL11_15995 [Ramlibacter sp. G-1-2-2]|uniref:DUF5666 domain-containing protein n=1 Tax=Ramlibacter agri TaxID=2728837 RepID=A0A848H423_9BURK|nr:hypothetical protein [Ramlibacter agri]NML45257.1 hypothetical protein [Ramlibacter agri]
MERSRRVLVRGAAVLLLALPLASLAQPASVRLRGTIDAITADHVTLRQRNGDRVELALAPNATVTEVYPVTLADVKQGSFVGVGAMPQSDGTQRAIAVTLFPEAMRGTGEGFRPFDFMPSSTMTNATVSEVAVAPDGQRLQLTYKDGAKTIVVPPGTPIVSLKPADRSLLVQGAVISVTAQEVNGVPTATRFSAGRNGFAPPY